MTYLETKLIVTKTNQYQLEIYKGNEMNFGVHRVVYSTFVNNQWISSNTSKSKAIKEAIEKLRRK